MVKASSPDRPRLEVRVLRLRNRDPPAVRSDVDGIAVGNKVTVPCRVGASDSFFSEQPARAAAQSAGV